MKSLKMRILAFVLAMSMICSGMAPALDTHAAEIQSEETVQQEDLMLEEEILEEEETELPEEEAEEIPEEEETELPAEEETEFPEEEVELPEEEEVVELPEKEEVELPEEEEAELPEEEAAELPEGEEELPAEEEIIILEKEEIVVNSPVMATSAQSGCPVEGATGTGTEADPVVVDTFTELKDALRNLSSNTHIKVESGTYIECLEPLCFYSGKTLTIDGTLYGEEEILYSNSYDTNTVFVLQGNGTLHSKNGYVYQNYCPNNTNYTKTTIKGNLTFLSEKDSAVYVNGSLTVEGGTFKTNAEGKAGLVNLFQNITFAGGSFPNGISDKGNRITLADGYAYQYADGTISSTLQTNVPVDVVNTDYELGFATQTPSVMPEGKTEHFLGNYTVGTAAAKLTFGFNVEPLSDVLKKAGYTTTEEMTVISAKNGIVKKQNSGAAYTIDNTVVDTYTVVETITYSDGDGVLVNKLTHTFTVTVGDLKFTSMSPAVTEDELSDGKTDLGTITEAPKFKFGYEALDPVLAGKGYTLTAAIVDKLDGSTFATINGNEYSPIGLGEHEVTFGLVLRDPDGNEVSSVKHIYTFVLEYPLEFLTQTPSVTEAEAAAGLTELGEVERGLVYSCTYEPLPQWMVDAGYKLEAYTYDYMEGEQVGFGSEYPCNAGGDHELVMKLTLKDMKGNVVDEISHTYTCYIGPEKATSIVLSSTQIVMEKNDTKTLTATVLPLDAVQKVTWSSGSEQIATVDENGKVTAVGYGTTIITATDVDGLVKGECIVSVTGASFLADGVALQPGQYLAQGSGTPTTTKPGDNYVYYGENSDGDMQLTLHNYTFNKTGYMDDSNWRYSIYSTEHLVLNLEGDNSIDLNSLMGDTTGIYIANGMEILGSNNDSLAISNVFLGLDVTGGLAMEGGTIDLNVYGNGIYSTGNITISGSKVKAVSQSQDAIKTISSGNLTINAGELMAISSVSDYMDSYTYALNVAGSVSYETGLYAIGSMEKNGSAYVTFDTSNAKSYDYVYIGAKDDIYENGIELDGVILFDGCYLDQGANASASSPSTEHYAYYSNGVLSLYNYESDSTGIVFENKDLTVYSEGNRNWINQITSVSGEANLVIDGNALLRIGHQQWTDYAVMVYGEITFKCDTEIECVDDTAVCDVDDPIIVDGADVIVRAYTGTSDYATTIGMCEAPITVRKGSLYLYADSTEGTKTDSRVTNADDVIVYANQKHDGNFTDADIITKVTEAYDLDGYTQVKIVHKHKMTFHNEVPATCEQNGNEAYYECSSCEKLFWDEAAAKEIQDEYEVIIYGEHKFDHYEYNDEYHWNVCSCGHIMKGSEGEHTYDSGVVTTPPTCTSIGERTYTCTCCGRFYTEDIGVEEHSFEDYVLNGDGTKTGTCKNCPETETVKDVKGEGYSGTFGAKITWFIDSQNTLYIEGEGDMPDGEVPWKDHSGIIEKIVIDPGITSIGEKAFEGCSALEDVTIPDTVTSIGEGAFDDENHDILFHVNGDSEACKWLIENGFTNIDAKIAIENISLPETVTLTYGQEGKLSLVISPDDVTVASLFDWDIADETIVSYDPATETITPVSVGESTITATEILSGKTASTTVKVILPKTDTLKAEFNTPIEAIGLQQGDHRTLCISSQTAGVITNDKFNFKSSNPGALQVDENGVVTSCYTGTGAAAVSITATLKADSSKKVTVKVNAIAKQAETITFDVQIPPGYEDLVNVVYDEATSIQTVIVSRTAIKDGKLPFKVTAISKDMDGNELPVSIKWSTSNSKAVAVAATKGVLNESTVTVQKNVNDIVEITATANDKKKTKAALDVDVRDYTPRLLSNSVTLNTNKLEGVSVRLLTAYDALLMNYSKEMLMMLSGLDDVINVSLEGNDAFTASYDKDSHLVTFYANKQMPNKKTYKLKLYVNTTQGLTEQDVTIKTANTLPSVSVKQQAVFNTFYKDSKVGVDVTAKDVNITNVTLSDTDTFKIVFDSVTKQCKLMFAEGYTGGKADVSAKVNVEFEGYRTPVVKSLSIKAKETQPKLQQSRTKTALTYLNLISEPITVLNTTSNETLNFDGLTCEITSDSADYAEVTLSGTEMKVTPKLQSTNKFINNKTSHTFKLQVQADNWMKPIALSHTISVSLNKPSVSTKNTKLTLRTLYAAQGEIVFKPSVESCTAPVDYLIVPNTTNAAVFKQAEKLNFEKEGWTVKARLDAAYAPADGKYSYKITPVIKNDLNEDVELNTVTVTVTVSSSNPTVSLKAKTLTLNAASYEGAAKTEMIPSESDCPQPVRYEVKPASTKQAVVDEAEKVKVTFDAWDVSADFKYLNDLPDNGSYKYNITAFVKNHVEEEIALTPISFTVKVNTTAPKVTLQKTSITLNKAVNEGIALGTTVNAGYAVVNMLVTPMSGSPGSGDLKVAYDAASESIQAVVLNDTLKNATYKYSITPIVKLSEAGVYKEMQLKALTLSIKVNSGTPSFKTSAKGSIDLTNRENGIVYTITGGQYFNYDVENIKEGSFVLTGEDAHLFKAEYLGRNSKDQIQVIVKAKAESVMDAKTTYQYKLTGYEENIGKVVESSLFKVKTKQTGLKFTVSGDTTVYHSHRYGNEILISVQTPTGALIEDLSVLQTKATTVPAGALSYDLEKNADGTWSVNYDVIRASKLKAGKSYKLALSVVPEGNGTNVKPQTLTVTLKIKR